MLVFLFILIVFKFGVNTVWLDIPQCHQEKESKEEEKLITDKKNIYIYSSFSHLKKKKKILKNLLQASQTVLNIIIYSKDIGIIKLRHFIKQLIDI